MPSVNVRVFRDGATPAPKAQIIAEITDTLGCVLGKKPGHAHVVIDEVDTDNWGFAGKTATELLAGAPPR